MNDRQMLLRLLEQFDVSDFDRRGQKPGLQFRLKEGVTIGDMDPVLEVSLIAVKEGRA